MSQFDYKAFEQYAKQFENMQKDFDTFLKEFLLEMAQRAVAKIKQRQRAVGAVDTGAMINSWFIGSQQISLKETGGKSKSGKAEVTFDPDNSTILDIDVVGSNIEVVIGNSMEYSSFIEYGSTLRNGRWKQGYFMMTISIDEVQQQIPKRFENEFNKFLKNRGVG